MDNHILKYDVQAIDEELLLPAGTTLDRATMIDLARRHGHKKRQSFRFSELDSFKVDLKDFLAKPPYDVIFSDPYETNEVLSLIGKISVLGHVVDSLDYFKENDFETYRHSLMVFALSTLIMRHLHPDDNRISLLLLSLAGPSHDIGKTCVPLDILKKQTPLTQMEMENIQHHVLAGYVNLSFYTGDPNHLSALIARDHHEMRDGSGYPLGIKIFNEMVEIITLADIYDALISLRPYRPVAYDNRSALEELTRMADDGQIGWLALKTLVALNRKNRPTYNECEVSKEKRGIQPENNLYGTIAGKGDDR